MRGRGLLGVAVLSGAAALMYQAVWLRWFQLLFGSTAYAASATLCAFFAGLAIGADGFGRLSARSRRPLVVYAVLELGAALLALAVPLAFELYDGLYPGLYASFADRSGVFVAVKFALAFALMLPPALLLGGTLPLLATAYVVDARQLGRAGGRLYALNTLGAAAGSAAGVLWLPDRIGVPATYAVAIALSLLAAAGALALARMRDARPETASPAAATPEATRTAARGLLAIAFASGFGTLALEVLLIHALAQILDHSVYSYGSVLVVVLLALASGAALVSFSEGRIPSRTLLVLALFAEALLLWALPARIEGADASSGPGRLLVGLGAAARLGGPPLLVGALVLPLTFRLAASEAGGAGRRMGGLLAANTLGGILGSLAASFLLLDVLGLWASVAVLGLAYGLAAIAGVGTPRQRGLRAVALVAAGAAFVFSPWNPLALPPVTLGPEEQLVAHREGAYGVVSVIDGPHGRLMKLNNHYTLSGAGRYGARKERAGHLPLLLHPDPKRVLFLGSATGHTAGAAVLHPVEEIVLVEIVPQVQELAALHFATTNRGVHGDPRTRLVVEDGRNHLRATEDRYDVVVGDLFSPWRPGVGSLYTLEHFEAVRERLAPGGVFCQWLPVYQHTRRTFATLARTFLEVFPDATVWRGDFYRTVPRVGLVGFRDGPPDPALVEARVRVLGEGGVDDRWVTDPRGFWMLYAGRLDALRGALENVPMNSDERPRFEYLAGRARGSEARAFLMRQWPAIARRLLAFEAGPLAPLLPRARDGAELARVNALHLAGRQSEFREALSALRARVPAELLGPPDPTVAEMWDRDGG